MMHTARKGLAYLQEMDRFIDDSSASSLNSQDPHFQPNIIFSTLNCRVGYRLLSSCIELSGEEFRTFCYILNKRLTKKERAHFLGKIKNALLNLKDRSIELNIFLKEILLQLLPDDIYSILNSEHFGRSLLYSLIKQLVHDIDHSSRKIADQAKNNLLLFFTSLFVLKDDQLYKLLALRFEERHIIHWITVESSVALKLAVNCLMLKLDFTQLYSLLSLEDVQKQLPLQNVNIEAFNFFLDKLTEHTRINSKQLLKLYVLVLKTRSQSSRPRVDHTTVVYLLKAMDDFMLAGNDIAEVQYYKNISRDLRREIVANMVVNLSYEAIKARVISQDKNGISISPDTIEAILRGKEVDVSPDSINTILALPEENLDMSPETVEAVLAPEDIDIAPRMPHLIHFLDASDWAKIDIQPRSGFSQLAKNIPLTETYLLKLLQEMQREFNRLGKEKAFFSTVPNCTSSFFVKLIGIIRSQRTLKSIPLNSNAIGEDIEKKMSAFFSDFRKLTNENEIKDPQQRLCVNFINLVGVMLTHATRVFILPECEDVFYEVDLKEERTLMRVG